MPKAKPKYGPRPGSHLVMVIPDIHFPDHDESALRCVLDAHRLLKPRRTVLLGDVLDCAGFSQHGRKSKNERLVNFLTEEIEPCRKFLTQLEKNTQEIIFIEGNHEWRVERLITKEQGAFEAIEDLILPKKLLAQNRKKKFTWIPYSATPTTPLPHYRIAEDLIAIHGWSHAMSAAKKHLDIAKRWSVVYGHTHRRQADEVREPIDNEIYAAWSPGCLSQLQPVWGHSSPTNWTQGFSLIWVRNDLKDWTEYSPRIKKGVCILPDGRKVDGNK